MINTHMTFQKLTGLFVILLQTSILHSKKKKKLSSHDDKNMLSKNKSTYTTMHKREKKIKIKKYLRWCSKCY